MSCIVYQTNKKTGAVYAYESISYWDKDKGQPRSKRKYLGRVDPETKEIVKKSQVKSIPNEGPSEQKIRDLEAELVRNQKQLESLQLELSQLQSKYKKSRELLHQINVLTALPESKH